MPTKVERQIERDKKLSEILDKIREIYDHLGLGEEIESEEG